MFGSLYARGLSVRVILCSWRIVLGWKYIRVLCFDGLYHGPWIRMTLCQLGLCSCGIMMIGLAFG